MEILVNIVPGIEKIHPEEPERLTIDMTLNLIEDIDSDMLHREFFGKHKETLKSKGAISVIVKGAEGDRYDQACMKVVKYLEYSEIKEAVTWKREGETAEADTSAKARLSCRPTVTRRHAVAGTAATIAGAGLVVSSVSRYSNKINEAFTFGNDTNSTLGLSSEEALAIQAGVLPAGMYVLLILTAALVLTKEQLDNLAKKDPQFNGLVSAATAVALISTLVSDPNPGSSVNAVSLAMLAYFGSVFACWLMSGPPPALQEAEETKSACKRVLTTPEPYICMALTALIIFATQDESDAKTMLDSAASLGLPTAILLLQSMWHYFNGSYESNGSFVKLAVKPLPMLASFLALAFYSAEQKFVASKPNSPVLRVAAFFAPALAQTIMLYTSKGCSKAAVKGDTEEKAGLLSGDGLNVYEGGDDSTLLGPAAAAAVAKASEGNTAGGTMGMSPGGDASHV